MSTVLDNYYDPNYDPTPQEVEDYGKWLGLELPAEASLLWIARDGLKAPLPENWKACKSEKGELYYFNFRTGQSIWDHPSDELFKERVVQERAKLQQKENGKEELTTAAAAEDGEAASASAASSRSSSTKSEKKEKASKKETADAKEKKKAEKKAEKTAAPAPEEEESNTASKTKGTKLAQLKTLKGGRKSAVTLVDEPTSHASPHAKTKELAPVLKRKEPTTSVLSTGDASPQPKDPNAGKETASILVSKPVLSSAVTAPAPTSPTPDTTSKIALESATTETQASGSPTSEKALASYKAREEQRLEAEKNAARASFDQLLKQAKEQLADNHNRKVGTLMKDHERKLADAKDTLAAKHKSSLEKFTAEMDATFQMDKNKIQNQIANDIAELKEKETSDLKSKYESEIAAMKSDFEKKMEHIRSLQKKELETEEAAIATADAEALVAEGMTAATALLKDYVQGVETLMTQFTKELTSQELKELRAQAEATKAGIAQAQEKELECEKSTGAKAVEAFRTEFEAKLQEEKRSSEQKLSTLIECNEAERSRAVAHHEKMMSSLRDDHAALKTKTVAQFDEEISFLKAAHASRLEELQIEMARAFEERKATLVDHYHQQEEEIISGAGDPKSHHEQVDGMSQVHRSASDVESDMAEAADMLQNFPTPTPAAKASSNSTNPPTAQGTPKSANLAEDLVPPKSDLKAAIYAVVQDVLQAHPALRAVATTTATNGVNEDGSSAADEMGGYEDDVEEGPASKRVVLATKGTEMSFQQRDTRRSSLSGVPTCLAEQQELLSQEQERVDEARHFVSMQRKVLAERREKLKTARRNWKKDVLEAKSRGATAGSSQAALLRKVQKVLDQQAEGLEHDEEVLQSSEEWFKLKENRVSQLADDLATRGDCDLSALSIDTQQLMAPLKTPQGTPRKITPPPPALRSALKDTTNNLSQPQGSKAAKSAATPAHTSSGSGRGSRSREAMERIETRLDAMAHMISTAVVAAPNASGAGGTAKEATTTTSTSKRVIPPTPMKTNGVVGSSHLMISGPSSARGPAASKSGMHPSTAPAAATARRRRSNSGTRSAGKSSRHVDFASAYPTGANLLWV